MAQIDRIIIRFEIHGGREAQLILTTMNQVLMQMRGTAGKASAGMMQLDSTTGLFNRTIQVAGNYTSDTILKISEFAVVIFALVGAYKALLGPIVDVEKNMAMVKAVSHATAEELRALQNEAVRLGTIFPGGAAKATEALVKIGQAGYDTRQSLELLEPVFRLATIGEVDFERAIGLIIPTLNMFNLSTAESARVVDVLTASIGSSLTDFETFAVALPEVAGFADALNVSLEDVVSLFSVLADRGLVASKISTAVKNVFGQLTKESAGLKKALEGSGLAAEDLNIESLGLRKVIENVSKANLNAAEKFELLGLRGLYAAGVFKEEGVDAFDAFMIAVNKAGEASFQSATILGTLVSKWGQLGGTIHELLLSIFGPLTDVLKDIVDKIKLLVKVLDSLSPGAKEAIRWLVGLSVALLGVIVWLKATGLLIGFLVKQFVAAKAASLVMIASFQTIQQSLRALQLGFITTGQAASFMWKSIAGPLGIAIAIIGTIGLLAHQHRLYAESTQGMVDSTEDLIAKLNLQKSELEGLAARIQETGEEYERLKKEEKPLGDTTKTLVGLMRELVTQMRELGTDPGDTISYLRNFESALGDAKFETKQLTIQIDNLISRLEQLRGQTKLELAKSQIGDVFAPPGMTYPSKPLYVAPSAKYKYEPFENMGGLFSEFLMQRGEDLRGYEIYQQKENEPAQRFTKEAATEKDIETLFLGINMATLDEFSKFIETKKAGLGEGEKKTLSDRYDKVLEIATDIAIDNLEKNIQDVTGDTDDDDGDGDGGGAKEPDKFKVPGVAEFAAQLSYQDAINALDEMNQKIYLMTKTRKSALDIEKEMLLLQKSNNDSLMVSYQIRIGKLQQLQSELADEEAIQMVADEIFKLEIQMIKLKTDGLNIDLQTSDVNKQLLDRFLRPQLDFMLKLQSKYQEIYDSVKDITKEMQDIQTFGEMFGTSQLDVAKEQLSYIEGQIRNISELIDKLNESTGSWGWLLRRVTPYLEVIRDRLQEAYGVTKEDIEEKEVAEKEKKAAEDIYDSVYESTKNAIADGIMSGKVKDAIEALGDLIKQAFAEKLAGIITDKLLGGFVSGLSVFQGGAAAGAAGAGAADAGAAGATGAGAGAGAAAGMNPWLAGLFILSMVLPSILGAQKQTAKGIDAKLDYILRGGGYRVPEAFVLPEPGEFAWRNRGKEGLSIRFPKRGVDVNIKHTFEWQPMELAKAIASTISVGGMQGAKQFGYVGY